MNNLKIPTAVLPFLAIALFASSGCEQSTSVPTTAPAPATRSTNADIAATDKTSPEPSSSEPVVSEPVVSKPAIKQPVAGKTVETSFDDLELKMERGDPFNKSLLTPKVKGLFGQKIRLRGFMLSTPRKSGLKEFVLIRDDQQCCFGPGSFLFHSVLVRMQGDATAEYTLKPITVEGTFRFDEFLDPISGNHLAIYAIDGNSAE